jgi:hypothetical protein
MQTRILILLTLLVAASNSLEAQVVGQTQPLLQFLGLRRNTNSVIETVQVALNGDRQIYRDSLIPALRRRHQYKIEVSDDLLHWTRYGGASASYLPGTVTVSLASIGGGASSDSTFFIRASDAGLFRVPPAP